MKDTSVQVQVVTSLGFRSSTLENLQIEDPVANLATGALPPDGASTGLWPVVNFLDKCRTFIHDKCHARQATPTLISIANKSGSRKFTFKSLNSFQGNCFERFRR